MAVKHVNLFDPAERQQLMAAQMMQTPAIDTSQWRGRQTPEYGVGHGLIDAGQKLAAAWMARKADKRAASDDEKRRRAQAEALAAMSRPQNYVETAEAQSPFSRAQNALNAGVDPSLVEAYMGQKLGTEQGADPTKVQEYNFAKQNGYQGSFEEYLNKFYGREQNTPAVLQEWEVVKAMTPQERADYLEMKRTVPVERINQVPTRLLPGGGLQPLSTVESEATAAADIKSAETTAAETAKVQTEAKADLPRVEQNAGQAINVIDQLLQHPGFSGIFGASSMLQPQMVPGSKWADANALLNQVKGKTFLEAFQTLKGGGQITELEGTKAEQAIARLSQAQSEDAARQALEELKMIAMQGVHRARQRAGVGLPEVIPNSSSGQMTDFSKMTDEQLQAIINGQ